MRHYLWTRSTTRCDWITQWTLQLSCSAPCSGGSVAGRKFDFHALAYFVFVCLTAATNPCYASSRQGAVQEALSLQNGANYAVNPSPRPARKHMLLVGATRC